MAALLKISEPFPKQDRPADGGQSCPWEAQPQRTSHTPQDCADTLRTGRGDIGIENLRPWQRPEREEEPYPPHTPRNISRSHPSTFTQGGLTLAPPWGTEFLQGRAQHKARSWDPRPEKTLAPSTSEDWLPFQTGASFVILTESLRMSTYREMGQLQQDAKGTGPAWATILL